LRHSAASVLLTRGVPLKVVSDLLGHSSIAIAGGIYGHVSPDVAREAIEMLGDAFDQERGRRDGSACQRTEATSRSVTVTAAAPAWLRPVTAAPWGAAEAGKGRLMVIRKGGQTD
jgi:hypothetical protein